MKRIITTLVFTIALFSITFGQVYIGDSTTYRTTYYGKDPQILKVCNNETGKEFFETLVIEFESTASDSLRFFFNMGVGESYLFLSYMGRIYDDFKVFTNKVLTQGLEESKMLHYHTYPCFIETTTLNKKGAGTYSGYTHIQYHSTIVSETVMEVYVQLKFIKKDTDEVLGDIVLNLEDLEVFYNSIARMLFK